MIVSEENKKSTKKLLELISEFKDTTANKVNITKINHTSNKKLEKKVRKINHLHYKLVSKNIKYLQVNLTKFVQDLFTKNYKTLKEIKELNKWCYFYLLEDSILLRC